MANIRFYPKGLLTLSHWPTLMLVIGYPIYWVELFYIQKPYGQTTPLAWIVFFVLSSFLILKNSSWFKENLTNLNVDLRQTHFLFWLLVITNLIVCGFIILIGITASLLPPHLMQEYDAIHYHYTIARQHLILHSFNHIPWSTADFFPLPVQFALSPFWFATALPNKVPQFIFVLGLLFVSMSLIRYFLGKNTTAALLMFFAVLGSHGFGIQIGTAMLDVVLCYLFLAAIDSFLKKNIVLAAIEGAFLFWAKSFIPFQIIFILLVLWIIFLIFKKHFNFIICSTGESAEGKIGTQHFKKFLVLFLAASLFIAGPFLLKSFYYTGTPLYPFKSGLLKIYHPNHTEYWADIENSSQTHLNYRDSYGSGRGVGPLLKHFWVLAVPEKGVNNQYDYPVGLVYLLFLFPFIVCVTRQIKGKTLSIFSLMVILFWMMWWMGSQQARFLYIPIILLYIVVIVSLRKPSVILMGAIFVALLFNALSVFRAHRQDLFKSPLDVLRKEDKDIISINRNYIDQKRAGSIGLDFPEAAFAQFPVDVIKEKYPYVIKY